VKEILKNWNMENELVELHYESNGNKTWKIGSDYFLKYASNPEELKKSIGLNLALASVGVPVITYLKMLDDDVIYDKHYCLTKRINGENIKTASCVEVRILGYETAKLHLSLSSLELDVNVSDNDFLNEWSGWIKPGLADVNEDMIQLVDEKLTKHYHKLKRSIIHRDVQFGNVMYEDGKFTGWLDFDLTRKDIRIFDLAYFLAGLLMDYLETPEKENEWFAFYDSLIEGYQEIEKFTELELEMIPVLIIAIELLFVAWCGEQGDISGRNGAEKIAVWVYKNLVIKGV